MPSWSLEIVDECVWLRSMRSWKFCGQHLILFMQILRAWVFQTNESAMQCTACPKGTYSTNNGSSTIASCRVCGKRRYTDKLGSISCKLYPAGTTLNIDGVNAEYHDDASDCEDYPVLQFSPFEGHGEECYLCQKAKTTGAASCDGCRPGTFKVRIVIGDGNKTDECYACPAGFFPGKQNSRLCEACPLGYFAKHEASPDGEIWYDSCQSCPRGKFGVAVSAKNVSQGCQKCTRGRYS